ncbi:hypothetical protein BJ508DRAFT_313535 [Ascobolus immersus RN42]|uniref:Uncharacterized protein n=1 Tax=Ascobolus immersus RN42 TaxID=1160509 RepID=A0A3N4HLA1_ASCIM|nr:hypothetical protein BJ508DRAFT_313535 [Ascobolus immersus RN42]
MPDATKPASVPPDVLARIINLRIRQIEFQLQEDSFHETLDTIQLEYGNGPPTKEEESDNFDEWLRSTIRPGWPSITPDNVPIEEHRITALERALMERKDELKLIETAIAMKEKARFSWTGPTADASSVDHNSKHSIEQRIRKMSIRILTFNSRIHSYNARVREMMTDLTDVFGGGGLEQESIFELPVEKDTRVSASNLELWEQEMHKREQIFKQFRESMLGWEALAKLQDIHERDFEHKRD